MRRCSFAWDSHTSEIIDLGSSSDGSDDISRRPRLKTAKKKSISKNVCRAKYRISSDDSSSSDMEIIYSDDDVKQPVTPRKLKDLILPRFSYDTPDRISSLKTNKLLRDISNICGTRLKSDTNRSLIDASSDTREKTGDGAGISNTKSKGRQEIISSDPLSVVDRIRENDRLFDSLLAAARRKSGDETVAIGDNDSSDLREKAKECEDHNLKPVFKVPLNNVFKKQKEISNKVKNPVDSKIVRRRTDDSDSSTTDYATHSSVENLEKLCGLQVPEIDDDLAAPANEASSDVDDGDFYTKTPQPPVRRKPGKKKTFDFTDWKDILDDIDRPQLRGRDDEYLGFLGSLDDTIGNHICHPKAAIFKEKFAKEKENLTSLLFRIFNEKVFEARLPTDMKIKWSGRMTSTAGLTRLSRKISAGEWQYLSSITLSTVIITTASRLRDTLIHEMCHAAVWLIDRKKDGHGPYWREWTTRARIALPELRPINVSHTYSKVWKYHWECTDCGCTVGRMSKSFDTEKFRCGRCRGRFQLKEDPSKPKRKPGTNVFANFVKQNYAKVKLSNAESSHKEIMKLLSQRFKDQKTGIDENAEDTNDEKDVICLE